MVILLEVIEMEQQVLFEKYLKNFTECQKEVIAEMVSGDCVLIEVWQEYVADCIKYGVWKPEQLLHSIVDRVEEIVNDINQFTECDREDSAG